MPHLLTRLAFAGRCHVPAQIPHGLGRVAAWTAGMRATMNGIEAKDLPDRYAGVDARIPAGREELRGPSSGVVHLPTQLAWSGLTDFDVADPGDRFALSCLLLDCGQRSDVGRYVSGDLLRQEPFV